MRRLPTLTLLPLLVFGVLALAASPASATLFTWSAIIDGLQETPPNASPATGSASGAYDDVTNLLTWTGTFSGLTANSSDAHFHGPAAAGVGPAGIQVPMTVAPDIFPLGVMAGAFSGTATLTAAQETMFLDEELYINIHSVGPFAGGEIRGQVLLLVPEPATLGLLALGFAGLALARRR